MRALILLLMMAAQSALAQCPPGARGADRPAPVAVPPYQFRAEAGNPPPWTTAVRVSWEKPGSRETTIGSGTILSGEGGRCVVMTAGHVLRGAPAGQIRVEIFGGPYDPRSGSLGPPTATYTATALDRDDAHDVGLLTFPAFPGSPIAGSPLPSAAWEPSKARPLCSVGCSKGEDATARSEQFTGIEPVFGSGWKGTECRPVAIEGRSGGGLFTEAGELVGVCDFSTPRGTGLYAALDSLREILRKNGLTELAEGGRRSKRPAPEATPIRPAPATGPDRPPAIIPDREPESPPSSTLLIPILSGLGLGIPGLLAAGWALAQKSKARAIPAPPAGPAPAAPPEPADPEPAPGRLPAAEELIPLLLASIRARADHERARVEAEAQARGQTALLDQILKLIEAPAPAQAPDPSPAKN